MGTALASASLLVLISATYAGALFLVGLLAKIDVPFLALFLVFVLLNLPPGLRSAEGVQRLDPWEREEYIRVISEFQYACRRDTSLRAWPRNPFGWWFAVSQILKRELVVTWVVFSLITALSQNDRSEGEFVSMVLLVALVFVPFSAFEAYRTGRMRLAGLTMRERLEEAKLALAGRPPLQDSSP